MLTRNYVENFTQSFLNAINDDLDKEMPNQKVTLMIGGDGRFYGLECIAKILKICAANPRIGKVMVAQDGIMSTPAVSCCIRKYKAYAGIILTASHNPGGPNNDFGIKFNCANGGPALQYLTDRVYAISTKINEYDMVSGLECNVAEIGSHVFRIDDERDFVVDVIDSVQDYLELMKEIFDFDALKRFFQSGVRITVNSLNGVMGPYVKRILCQELG